MEKHAILNLAAAVLLVMNVLSFSLMGADKRRAKRGKWRIRERTLLAAYNAQFDLNFLYHFLRPFGRADVLRAPRFLDVLTVYRDRRAAGHEMLSSQDAS